MLKYSSTDLFPYLVDHLFDGSQSKQNKEWKFLFFASGAKETTSFNFVAEWILFVAVVNLQAKES